MLQLNKNNIIISRKSWEELRKNDYFRELIEVLEDSEELEKAKKESNSFMKLRDYIKNREKKENRTRNLKNPGKRLHV